MTLLNQRIILSQSSHIDTTLLVAKMESLVVISLLCATFLATHAQHSEEEGNHFEGDMILTPDQMSAVIEQESKNSHGFAALKSKQWKTNGKNDVIQYFIESSLISERRAMDAITDAIGDYHKYTCIRFQRVYSKPSGSHISFFKGGGCFSYVGKMTTRDNQISLGNGCWSKGTAMHEIGHSLGFFHEQSRPDRDNFVRILTDNIRPYALNNFNKLKTSMVDSLNSPYDYESMMHYGKSYFKKSAGLITIQTLDPKYQNVIGQRDGFSRLDIDQFNKMYNCISRPTAITAAPTTGKSVATTTEKRVTTATPVTGCFDKPEFKSKCVQWKNICYKNSYVRKNCRMTCSLCSGTHVTTSAAATTATTTTTTTTTKKRPTTSPPVNGCVDKPGEESFCQNVKIICSTNDYVKKTCPHTCDQCPVTCQDETDTCVTAWKKLCPTNSYVQRKCPKTCGIC